MTYSIEQANVRICSGAIIVGHGKVDNTGSRCAGPRLVRSFFSHCRHVVRGDVIPYFFSSFIWALLDSLYIL